MLIKHLFLFLIFQPCALFSASTQVLISKSVKSIKGRPVAILAIARGINSIFIWQMVLSEKDGVAQGKDKKENTAISQILNRVVAVKHVWGKQTIQKYYLQQRPLLKTFKTISSSCFDTLDSSPWLKLHVNCVTLPRTLYQKVQNKGAQFGRQYEQQEW